MIAVLMAAFIAAAAEEGAGPAPPPAAGYTVSDAIGRNPDDVCMLAYHSGRWSDWLKADFAEHRAHQGARKAMMHYCDGFIHGMKYKGQ